MKIILAIIQDKDGNRLLNELIGASIYTTGLSSTGGFLRAGNSTFIVGIEDDRVEKALKIIRRTCESRRQFTSTPVTPDILMDGGAPYPVEVEVGSATVFILPAEGLHQFQEEPSYESRNELGSNATDRISAASTEFWAWAYRSCLSF